jgi:Yip1 domain
MEQPETPPVTGESAPALAVPTTSLASRMMNVFASPGEAFDEVKGGANSAANSMVPVLLLIVAGIIFVLVAFSQPAVQQQMTEAREKALSEKVKKGEMTQAQKDQAEAVVDKYFGPSMMKALASGGVVVVDFVRLYWWGFIIWLLGRWALHARFSYMKAVEVAGLSAMIVILGTVVTLLMVVGFGKLSAGPSLALAVGQFDSASKQHQALAAVNVFNFWYVGVVALGLARLAGSSFTKAALWVFGYWVVWEALLIAVGMGSMAM